MFRIKPRTASGLPGHSHKASETWRGMYGRKGAGNDGNMWANNVFCKAQVHDAVPKHSRTKLSGWAAQVPHVSMRCHLWRSWFTRLMSNVRIAPPSRPESHRKSLKRHETNTEIAIANAKWMIYRYNMSPYTRDIMIHYHTIYSRSWLMFFSCKYTKIYKVYPCCVFSITNESSGSVQVPHLAVSGT